jgi:hypothetical protein
MYGKKTLTLEWFNRYELVFEVENEEGTKETGYYIQVSTDVYGKLKPFATFYAIGKKEHWVLNDGEVNYSGNPYRSGLAPNECMGIYFVLTAGGRPPLYKSVYYKPKPPRGQANFIPPDDTTSSAMGETIVRMGLLKNYELVTEFNIFCQSCRGSAGDALRAGIEHEQQRCDEPLQVLHEGGQVGLNLNFGSSAVLGPR